MGIFLAIVSSICAVILTAYSIHKEKKFPRRAKGILWVLCGIIVLSQGYVAYSEKDEKKILNVALGQANSVLADTKAKLDGATGLLEKMSQEIKNQDLKREVEGFQLGMKIDGLKTEKGSSSPHTSNIMGKPDERIANSLNFIVNEFLWDWKLERMSAKSSRELLVEYYSAVEKVPSFYSQDEWKKAEEVIFSSIMSDIRSNLQKRNVYSKEWFDSSSSELKAERQRYLTAKWRNKAD